LRSSFLERISGGHMQHSEHVADTMALQRANQSGLDDISR
jgi:hypothetical protein